MKLALKSYFIMTQLHQKHIQATLHQVVELSSPEENAASIIIQNEIIHIENVNDTLCKNLWNHIVLIGAISYCDSHIDKHGKSYNPYSLKITKIFLKS